MTTGLFIAIFRRALFLGGVWLALTGASPDAMLLGALVVAGSIWLSLQLLPASPPLALWRLARHFPRFLAGSISGGADVAKRAFSTNMRLNPGWLEIPSDLPDGARVALGAELSLMPGTLSAGTEGGKLLVHLLDTDAGFDNAIPREAEEIAAIIGKSSRARA